MTVTLTYVGSRWLDPALGRWIQADSVISNPGNPVDFDRYAYVRNNPLLYIDPTGHMPDDPPSPFPGKALWVDGVIELTTYGPGAQYIVVPSDVYQDTVRNLSDKRHFNLCGHLAFAAIYEKEMGSEALGMIWNMYPTGPKDLSGGWAEVINDIDGWSATYKWFNSRNLQGEISQTLADGTYIMISSKLDLDTGRLVDKSTIDGRLADHWVVVTAATDRVVFIYDPYTNTSQRYSWKEFKKTYGVAILIRHDERFKRPHK